MADINEVRQRMMDELERKIRSDSQLASIRAKIQSGDPNVASQYAVRCGQILSGVACEHIDDEIFQNSTVADLASMLVPVIQRENEMVANAAAASQRNMNEDVGIGIRPQRAEFDASQYYNIFGRMQIYDSFEEAEYLLEEPLIQDSLVIVDESMKENAEFQYRSGLKTCVIREVESDCCDWCAERAGTYYFPDVPDEVWERHNDCRCEIRIETEKDESSNIRDYNHERANRIKGIASANVSREEIDEIKKHFRKLNIYYPELFDSRRNFYNAEKDELIANGFSLVKPISEFTDFSIHGDPYSVDYTSKIGQKTDFTAKEFADMLRVNPAYNGGNIRLFACKTGLEDEGFAKQLADELGVKVMAPTEDMWIADDGEYFISDNIALADLWYNNREIKQTGKWRTFPED